MGHLVSDADDGEDKLEKGAAREGKTAWDVAAKYSDDFKISLNALNITLDPHHLVKATDHIAEQIALIKILEKKGYTYVINDGVYFDSTKFKDYGKMARLDIAGQQAGKRIDQGDKKHGSDFALWKQTPDGISRDMEWESPWGKGFPGWHIECSAMAMKYLGETLDIHTGGIDHIPVHHTNEIAQSEAVTGKQFVRYWVHNNFLKVEGTKISKSLENGYTLHDLKDKGYEPLDFRMLVLQSHYQSEANFTWEGMAEAQTRRRDLQAFADLRYQLSLEPTAIRPNFSHVMQLIDHAMQENLNTPRALAQLSDAISKSDGYMISSDVSNAFDEFLIYLDAILGLGLRLSSDITNAQKSMIQQRLDARQSQDWQTADRIRDDLILQGIGLKDSSHGTIWYRL